MVLLNFIYDSLIVSNERNKMILQIYYLLPTIYYYHPKQSNILEDTNYDDLDVLYTLAYK